ncbi:MAG: hypothetical protein F7C08_00700 [Desulfurococcales archaeon]|nr:hypothetical protein [Desulfurococcales archaeon]MCE4605042.1 hypothetical protein [Desulfurococcales archaeon]
MKVIKRDGRVEEFSVEKLRASIEKALEGAGLAGMAEEVLSKVLRELEGESQVFSASIADRVERVMVEMGISDSRWFEAAKRYELAHLYNDVYGKDGWTRFDPRDLDLSFNAIKVLEARYLLKDPETWRFRETPQMLFRRVARTIASVEYRYGASEEEVKRLEEQFYDLISSRRFMPNTPTLMNAGTRLGILSACFVIPVRDSMTTPEGEGIMDSLRAQALIHQHGGGTGFDFSELRPEYDVVSSSGGLSSGPLSFMKLFDVATDVVKQGGKRRGANMGIMHVWHADIEKFIVAKTGELKDVHLQNFNISVGFYDDFFYRVASDMEWYLINPRKTDLSGRGDSRQYAIVRARHYIQDDWVQEIILDELEERGGSIALEDSKIITLNEALLIAKLEGAVTKTVKARELLQRIVEGAWDSGDPGFINIDEINRRHPVWYLGKINATNPCVSGDTRILTPRGWIEARELFMEAKRSGRRVPVEVDEEYLGEGGEPIAYETTLISSDGEAPIYKTVHGDTLRLQIPKKTRAWVWYVGRKPGLQVRTREGYTITVTHEHKFLTPEGWKEARELKPGDKILTGRIHPVYTDDVITGEYDLDEDIAFSLGWLVGDGTFNKHYVAWYFSEDDKIAEDRVRRGLAKIGGNPLSHTYMLSKSEHKIQYNNSTRLYKNIVALLGVNELQQSRDRKLPEIVWRLSPKSLRAFLRGLFTADGTVDNDKAIRLTSASRRLLEEVQILLSIFGIQSVIYERPYQREFKYHTKNGEERIYKAQGYYELVIKGYSRKLFKELIGFEDVRKLEKLELKKTKRDSIWATVDSVEDVGLVDFYDFTVPGTHTYIANGLINHNCGEEPLLPWEPCNLGSINLELYVVEEDGKTIIDWEALARDVRLAVRFLDNVIDANDPPLGQIREANLRTRKVGLGVMGWARMLIRLGIPYDSPDAIRLAWHVAEWIAWNAYEEGVEIARKKGPFPAWDARLYRWLHETLPFKSPEEYLRVVWEETGRSDLLEPPTSRLTEILAGKPETKWEETKRKAMEWGLRNATYLSIAPTGTISIIAGASASIEPLFALAFVRQVAVGTFIEVEPLFLEELRRLEMDDPEVIETIAETGSVAHLKWVPRRLRRIYRTAHDIDYEYHLLHQAVWQAWVDAGTSKTINMRHDEPVESVWRTYWLAWRLRIKGTTIYRDRSKSQQVIYFGVKKSEDDKQEKDDDIKPVAVVEPRREKRKEEAPTSEAKKAPKRVRVRLGKGKVKQLITVAEDYAGGCPTCDI